MLKYFFYSFFLLVLGVVIIAGFRGQRFQDPPLEMFTDMVHQKKLKAQVPSNFFSDKRTARVPVADTMPMGYDIPAQSYHETIANQPDKIYVENFKIRKYTGGPDYLNTGRMGEVWGDGIPIEVTPLAMQRGQERYNINCAVCHGLAGDGKGITGQFGMVAIANLHEARFLEMPDGEIYNTIVNGKGTMMAYGHQVALYDRWAIVAYIRALQRSQIGTLADLTPEERRLLEAQSTMADTTTEEQTSNE